MIALPTMLSDAENVVDSSTADTRERMVCIECPDCLQGLKVRVHTLGAPAACPRCTHQFRIPARHELDDLIDSVDERDLEPTLVPWYGRPPWRQLTLVGGWLLLGSLAFLAGTLVG